MDGQPKISTFLISMILVSFVIASISYFIADGNEKYSTNFNTTQIETLNNMNQLKTDIESYKNESTIKENPTALDVFGSYMKGGMKLISLSFGSFGTANSLIDDSANMIDIPQVDMLKTSLKLILIVLLVFGVLVAAIMKWRT